MTVQFDGIQTFLLVFVRMLCMLAFNPLMSRRNVPRRILTGLSLCMTLVLSPIVTPVPELAGLDMAFCMLREVFIGFLCGYVFQMFYYLVFFVGDFLDMEFGLSMSKVFDPGTNIQASITGTLLNITFMLYFFATDSHLVLIRLFAASFDIIAVGGMSINIGVNQLMLEVFISVFSLVLHLILPFAVAEFTVEVAMGVLMKLIPQIHVFVINMQTKILVALTLLLLLAPYIGSFIDRYLGIMLENMQRILLAGAA